MTHFADDSTVTINCKNKLTYESEINNNLKSVIQRLDYNNIKINVDKTSILNSFSATCGAEEYSGTI